MKDFYRTPKLAAYCMGSRTFVCDDFRTIPLREQIHQTGRQMLDLQQRIWELDEEITISEGEEKTNYVSQQNKLRKQYSALRKEKENLESGKIKPKQFRLEGYDINSDGYFIQRLDQIRDLEF